jgi:hypothetical protein
MLRPGWPLLGAWLRRLGRSQPWPYPEIGKATPAG